MPHIDPFTTLVVNSIGSLLMAVSLLAVSRGYLVEIKGIKRWVCALFLQGIGWALTVLLGTIPDIFPLVIAPALIFLSIACYFHALVEINDSHISTTGIYLLAAVAAVGQVYFIVFDFTIAAKIGATATGLFFLLSANALLLLVKQQKHCPVSHSLTGSAFAFAAAIMLVRAIYYLFYSPKTELNIFHTNIIQDISYLTGYIVVVMASFGFLLMCNDRYIAERKQMEQELKIQQAFTTDILNSLTAHIAVLNTQGEIMMVNQTWQQFSKQNGLSAALGDIADYNYLDACTKAFEQTNDKKMAEIVQGIKSVMSGEQSAFHTEYPCHSCEEQRWFHISISQLQNGQGGIVISHEDITARKRIEMELRIAATVFESQEGMLITDANSTILKVNQAFSTISGYSAAEVIGKTPRILSSGKHDAGFHARLWQSLQESGTWQGEIYNKRKNGDIYPEWLTITAVKGGGNGVVTHYVATITDISEQKTTEEHIHRLAFYDPLTQLPNRRLLQERLNQGIKTNRRIGSQMAVLMMDLDKFKAVNDTLGHAAGDELLKQVAERVKSRLREMDIVARLGGDEFVIVMENVSQCEHIARVAETIIHTLSQSFTLCQIHEVYIGASIGIAIHPQHGDNVEALMDNADAALYHAKDQGRGCFAYFTEALTQKTREYIALEARLRNAISQHELRVYFQPQIDIRSSKLVGAEALVRWYDPVKGNLAPDEFISLAEKTGLIVAVGEQVLRETCRLGRQWLDEGLPPVTLAINVSPYQFRRCDIAALVSQILEETRFPAEYLELEITESGLMENQEHALSILNRLHEQGVHLAIDDFGTGYSSLAFLKYFPLDVLKIDKTFIKDIPGSEDDMAITATIISMAHHLGFKVLAEGVETTEQLAFLQIHLCDRYQGYLYSKPLPVDDFARLLAESSVSA